MLQSDLCDYSDAYFFVKGTITVIEPNNANYKKELAFKNNGRFIFCIAKINNALIDNPENLAIVMPMFNLIEYSKSYSKTSGIIIEMKDSKPFDYKIKITKKGIDTTKKS